MEKLNKIKDDQGNKKVVVNVGKVARGGGGGIGAVILLGGALATAAFASAFIVRKRGRGSGNNSKRKAHNPPVPTAVNKGNEQDDANNGRQFTFLDTSLHVNKHPSSETRKEIEIKNDAQSQSLVLGEKPRTEINGGPLVDACDSGASEEILCSITLKTPENNVISDYSVTNKGEFHLPVMEEKMLPFELESVKMHDVKIQTPKKDAIDEITEECNGFKKVNAEEKQADGEVECEEAIEETKAEMAGIGLKVNGGICGNQEVIGNDGSVHKTFISENHCKDEQESILPVFESPIIEHENVNGDEKQGFLSTDVVEIIHEDEAIEGGREDQVKHTDEITKECNGFKKVNAEEKQAEGESRGDGEISEVECEEAIEETKAEVAGIGLKVSRGICGNQEVIGNDGSVHKTFVAESHCKDEQESILPVFESPIIEHENGNGDKKQGFLCTGVVEIIHEDEAIEGGGEDQVKHIEEQLLKEDVEEIIPQKCKESNDCQLSEVNKEEKIPCQNNEENACTDNPTPENRQFGDYDRDLQILTISIPEEEMISPKDIEVSKQDAANEEEVVCQQKDSEEEVEENIDEEVEGLSETIDRGIAAAKEEENIVQDFVDETVEEDLSDEVEQNSEGTEDSSMESNVGAVWPAEAIQESFIETQQVKFINQEVEGKIQEDTTVKQGEHELHQVRAEEECNSNKIIADGTYITTGIGNSAKTFLEKYVVDLATLKDYSTNSNTRRMLVATIPVLSSLSCSWFFGLSFDKLCLVVLLTIVLSKSLIIE